jgi:hypothetical protein
MDKQKLNEIIYNLERLLNELKLEINSEEKIEYEEVNFPLTDYDEIFEETDEYYH